MLEEVAHVTQYEPGKYRRWFHDDFFDLYTWETPAGEMIGFQLCYAKDDKQRALRWSAKGGYRHEGVDQPEDKPGRAASAIFVADGIFDPSGIGGRFGAEATSLPPKIKNFIGEKIRAYQQTGLTR